MGERMKKYAYDDNFSPIVNEIMFKANELLNSKWDYILQQHKVKSPYDLSSDQYKSAISEIREAFKSFMKWGEDYFLTNTFKNDDMPDECIYRANRAKALWTRWDWKYTKIISSYEFYS